MRLVSRLPVGSPPHAEGNALAPDSRHGLDVIEHGLPNGESVLRLVAAETHRQTASISASARCSASVVTSSHRVFTIFHSRRSCTKLIAAADAIRQGRALNG